ncbi:MAG TPA: hypothetical protein VGM80_17555 [Gaiellaceae bacterium]|jgi:hypothetical protein
MMETLAAVVDRGGDADDILREIVALLVQRGECTYAAILFAEGGDFVVGPVAGGAEPGEGTRVPVDFEGTRVAELVAAGCEDSGLLEQVAALIAPYCLVGWDTGGVPWDAG